MSVDQSYFNLSDPPELDYNSILPQKRERPILPNTANMVRKTRELMDSFENEDVLTQNEREELEYLSSVFHGHSNPDATISSALDILHNPSAERVPVRVENKVPQRETKKNPALFFLMGASLPTVAFGIPVIPFSLTAGIIMIAVGTITGISAMVKYIISSKKSKQKETAQNTSTCSGCLYRTETQVKKACDEFGVTENSLEMLYWGLGRYRALMDKKKQEMEIADRKWEI